MLNVEKVQLSVSNAEKVEKMFKILIKYEKVHKILRKYKKCDLSLNFRFKYVFRAISNLFYDCISDSDLQLDDQKLTSRTFTTFVCSFSSIT